MKLKRVHALRLSAPLAVALVTAIVLGGCPTAAKTSTDLSFGFGTEGPRVALIPTLTAGSPMTAVNLPEAMGASGTVTYSVMPVIPGLSFNPTTRVLSGTPTVAGTHTVTYSATTSGGEKASLRFTVKVLSSFVGTWSSSGTWWEDGQDLGTWKQALTFTGSRYIQYRSHYPTGSTSVDHRWVESGTWEATDTTVTRIWAEDHDDDGVPEVERRVRKNYLWSEGREVLCMQHWAHGEEELDDVGCDRYTRVRDPISGSINGVWESEFTWDDGQRTFVRTLTISESFTESYIETGIRPEVWTLTGSLRHDAKESFLFVTVDDLSTDGDDNPENFVGHELRMAFAPTGIDNQVAVSFFWQEMRRDQTTNTWHDSKRNPYGNYRWTFVRVTE